MTSQSANTDQKLRCKLPGNNQIGPTWVNPLFLIQSVEYIGAESYNMNMASGAPLPEGAGKISVIPLTEKYF